MLNFDNFRTAMKLLITATKTHDIGLEELKAYFSIIRNDFEDAEFREICLKISKMATFFPTVAEFYKHKKRPNVPTVGQLVECFTAILNKQEVDNDLANWHYQVMNYYTGSGISNWREITEKEWDWVLQAYNRAYDKFLIDYQSGSGVRIDYSEVPHITERTEKTGSLSDSLNKIFIEGK